MATCKLTNLFATFLLAVFVLVSVSAFAQSTTEGAIAGSIYDPQGAVVAGATVTVRNNGTNQEQTAT
ncbi:MAG TPA: carboxypeptidase-like regulatory domain-containing protein, partial [Terriglobales bacterium]